MKYQLHINKPCVENWQNMKPGDRGRFCSVCKKEVLDFSHLSRQSIFYRLEPQRKICAKIPASQLNKDFTINKRKSFFGTGIFFGLSTFLSFTIPAFSQSVKHKIEIIEKATNQKSKNQIEKINDSVTVRGIVQDKIGPLPGANIYSKELKISVQADFDGKFSITVPREEVDPNLELSISYIGYDSKVIKIYESTEYLKINLEEQEVVLGGVIIVPYEVPSKNIFQKIGKLFQRKNRRSCD